MARLRLSDPFDINPFSDLLRAVTRRPMQEARAIGHINLDVREETNAYRVEADLPGLSKEHIHVTIDGNHVEISAEAAPRPSQAGEHMLCRERHEGLFYRSFTLDHEIDDAKAEARYTDGVLALTLPKKRGAASHALQIS
jgi:HSP20 family protein